MSNRFPLILNPDTQQLTEIVDGDNLNLAGNGIVGVTSIEFADGSSAVKSTAVYTQAETDQRIADVIGAAPAALDTLNELAAALGNDADFAATVAGQLATIQTALDGLGDTGTALQGGLNAEVAARIAGDSALDARISGLNIGLVNKVINLEPPIGSSVTTNPLLANALASIGNTNGFTINLGFGEYREAGPVVIDNKTQLQIAGPRAASTTAVTIKNGLTIQNSAGVRLSSVQIEGVISIASKAGLGLHFEKSQFMGNLTVGGTGGFLMFTDCEIGANLTIPNTFAGVVYFIRCSFGNASGVYSLNQSSALQAVFLECSGIPNTGIAKASFSGTTTYKNGSQALFLNGVAVSNAGATPGQVLAFNGTGFAPATLPVPEVTQAELDGAVSTLQGAVAAEALARGTADTALSTQIAGLTLPVTLRGGTVVNVALAAGV